jgi:hypothetical protein
LDFDPVTNNKKWVLVSTQVKCPFCVGHGMLSIPSVPSTGFVYLFGDEANRSHAGQEVFTYSLVGAGAYYIADIVEKITRFKTKWEPARDPKSWRMHMREAWSGDGRLEHPVYHNWDFVKVMRYIEDILGIIDELQKPLLIYNVTVAGTEHVSQLRDTAYTALLMSTIDRLTSQGGEPHFVFDAERVCGEGVAIAGWADRLLDVKQRTLLYAFLARGQVVPDPRFVEPGSHPCLELADFISFWIARYHLRKWQGKESEVATERLGRINYLGMTKNGNFYSVQQKGFPWDAFYLSS